MEEKFLISNNYSSVTLVNVCSYVANAGLSRSARVTAEALKKTPQSASFNCDCTGRTLIEISLV